jgi:hypothetical protein
VRASTAGRREQENAVDQCQREQYLLRYCNLPIGVIKAEIKRRRV